MAEGLRIHFDSALSRCHNFFTNLLNDPISLAITVVILTTILLMFVYFVNTQSSRKQGVLVLGLCDSGKTLLFSLLTLKRSVMTHTSVRENKAKYEVKSKKNLKIVEIIDLPGHERIRGKYIKKYEDNARCIIFMIDSAAFPKLVRDVAEYLYDILTNKTLMNSRPPILITCNKQDLPSSKSCNVIKSQLEKEIDAMRSTRAAALKGTDDAQLSNHTDVGKKGKAFLFNQVASKIEFIESDLKKHDVGSVDQIMNWIEQSM